MDLSNRTEEQASSLEETASSMEELTSSSGLQWRRWRNIRPSIVRSDHHGADFYRDLWDTLLSEGFWQGEIWNRRKSGEVYLEWLTISRVAGTDGTPVRYLGVFSDITELRRKDDTIRHLAFHDPLTDLPNRSLLLNRLEHGIACAERDKTRLGVMFIDLDRFKAINDSLGHNTGDSLLREVAAWLKQTLRASDTVARMGGDEFVILLEHADGLEAYAAMYAAKYAGRGTYRFFQAAMTDKVMRSS